MEMQLVFSRNVYVRHWTLLLFDNILEEGGELLLHDRHVSLHGAV